MITNYPSIYAIGHKYILDIFKESVIIEEKVDGSQFSFMKDAQGVVHYKSKGSILYPDIAQKLFKKAVNFVQGIEPQNLIPEAIYRGEALCQPKHNTLAYATAPHQGFILFDVELPLQNFMSRQDKEQEAKRLGFEIVPILYQGMVENFEQLHTLLDKESFLGGCKIEGFVVKNYERMTIEKKIMVGKFVSEAFKEKHGVAWKSANPGRKDIIEQFADIYRHENRWLKAIQHLRDAGQLTETPKDIGVLIQEVQKDVYTECAEEIKESLFKQAWKQISPRLTRGLPEFYKEYLAKEAFDVAGLAPMDQPKDNPQN